MVSKNNLHLKQTKTADQTPHYGLRKLSVGVASVLLSTTLYLGTTAQADTLPTGDESQSPATSAVADSSSSSAGTLTIAQSAGSTADTQETTDSTASQVNSTATSQGSESAVSASPVSKSTVNSQNTLASSAASNASQTAESAVSASPASESTVNSQNMSAGSAASSADQTAKPAVSASPVSDSVTNSQDVPVSSAASNADQTSESAVNTTPASDSATKTQTIADDDPMNHASFQVTVHYKKDGETNTFMPDTVITTKYKRTTTKDLVTGKYTATPFVLESISQTGTKIDGLGTPAGVVKDVPAGWQYFTYSIPYNVSVPGWSQTLSGSSFTDAIAIAAGTSSAIKTAELTAIYAANTQTTHIKYVDTNGTVVKTDTISGKTDTTQTVNSAVPTGWKSVDGQTIPVTIKLGVNTPDAVVKVEHDHVMITSNNPQADGTDIPGGTTKFNGVADGDLNQTLIRTIIVKLPNGQTKALAQTVKISRDATVDMVDGSVVYGDWSTAQWPAYSVPTVAGYTPSQKTVEAKTVANGDKDNAVTINYRANRGTQTINYVDENGNPVVRQTLHGNVVVKQIIHGKTDQEIAVNHDKLFGWVLEDDQTVPTTVKIKAVDEPITIKLKHGIVTVTPDAPHGIVTVTPDAPKTEFDRMPDWTDKDYPAGVGYNDLNKTVMRTITFELPDGQTKTVKQTTTFTRHATVDEVTDAVAYSNWNEQSHTFDAIDVPGVDGWTPSTEQIADITVTPDSKDEQVTVAYTTNPKAPTEKVNQTDEVKSSESAPTAGVKETSAGTVANKAVEAENNVKADSHAKTAELPQTGNEQTALQAAAGLALTGLAVMLGLGRKKRKND